MCIRDRADYAQEFLPCLQQHSEGPPEGFPDYSHLPDVVRDAPGAGCAGVKKSDIARAEAAFLAILKQQERFAGDYEEGLILTVVPAKASCSAVPNHDRLGVV